MKQNLLLILALACSSLYSSPSFGGIILDSHSSKSYILEDPPEDSMSLKIHLKKMQWEVALGVTKTGPIGQSFSSSISYPINNFIKIQASTGLVTFRGPSFDYKTEYYYNDGTAFGYEINEYVIGDYLGVQSSIGVVITEPLLIRSAFHLLLII